MRQLFIVAFIFLSACNENKQLNQTSSSDSSTIISQKNTEDPISPKNIWIDRLNGQRYRLPDSIGDRAVSFYLDHPKVADIAKSFYKGQFRPTDNDSTNRLLSYVTTDDNIIRPFYRWCLDFTISISDGALAEYPGKPALAYAAKFPKEFFAYMEKDTSRQHYKQWTEIIAYSGLSDYNKKTSEIEKEIISKMRNNCSNCGDDTKSRILIFAKDIAEAIKLQD
jgi:hypothetical protein